MATTAEAPPFKEQMRPERPREPTPVPAAVRLRIDRAVMRMDELAPERNECWEFFRGNTYTYRNSRDQLITQETRTSPDGKGRPKHRVRTKRPILTPLIRQEVSYATQRVPSYEVSPSNTDPRTVAAARVAEKAALYGYDKWRIKQVTEDVVTSALVADEGFAWPFWDDQTGPPVAVDPKTGRTLHQGEVGVRVLSANEVGWEPGVRFEDARCYIVRQARSIDRVLEMPGILVDKLVPDASNATVIGSGKPGTNNLVMVTEYLERPCPRYPRGRRLVIANERVILPEMPYPLTDPQGLPVDEPVLHKLSVIRDPDSDRDLGLVRFMLDAVRTYQDANNKALEWKNLALNPQVIAPPGTILTPLTDEPGSITQAARPDLVKWREVPEIPDELFEIMDRAKADLGFIGSQNDIPSQVEAARAIQALVERDTNARAAFLGNLAEWHSRLMRHCLALMARHYTEPRLLRVNGRWGTEVISGFKGADLMDQIDVRVYPGSLEPRTRQAIETKIMAFADRGWISPQAAMAAINGGTAEKLVDDYELAIGRAHQIIEKIKAGPETLFNVPPRLDPLTGQEVDGWMPRPFDKVPIQIEVFESWMQTVDFDQLPIDMKHAAELYYSGLKQIEAQQMAQQQMAQAAMAEGLGMQNAARPQDGKPMPDQPGITGPGGQPGQPSQPPGPLG